MLTLKLRSLSLAVALVFVGSGVALAKNNKFAEMASKPHVANEILVKFSKQHNSKLANKLLKKAGADNAREFKHMKRLKKNAEIRQWRRVKLKKGMTVEQALAKFENMPGVEAVEPNYLISLDAIRTTNDTRVADQWALHQDNTLLGSIDSDIDMREAWDIETGNKDVVVAVIDTGVDYNHEDLAGNIWINDGEIDGDGVDNDNNGYVDDVRGWDFGDDDNDPMDNDDHGTHVAGIIGALSNNGKGVAGIAWNVSLMPVKFFDSQGDGSKGDAIEAINYAVSNGAHIINGSWSSSSYSASMDAAIQAARDAGVLYVASAGNNGVNIDSQYRFPASLTLDNVLTVGNSDTNDGVNNTSNYGSTNVDIFAPGTTVLSTTPYDTYLYQSGTSMSAPMVAGVAALLKAQNMDRTYPELKKLILSSAEDHINFANKSVTGGRLNAHSALVAGQAGVSNHSKMYVRGSHNNWDGSGMALVGDTWHTVAYFANESAESFKFEIGGGSSWSTNYGDNNADGYAEENGGNIAVSDGSGFYEIMFNDHTKAYSLNKISLNHDKREDQMYLRSSLNGYNAVPMSLVADHEWEVGVTVGHESAEFKFDVHGDWSSNFGEVNADFTADVNGDAIAINNGAGIYTIKFNDENHHYSITKASPAGVQSQMYLRGTNNSWGTSSMMRTDTNEWQIVANFGSGAESFKFDVAGDWATSYGDNDIDGVGDLNGSNISISGGAGDYLIIFNDSTLSYSVEKVGYGYANASMNLRGTFNGWTNTGMTLVGDNIWMVLADFSGQSSKQVKFDVTGDWSNSYGDNNADGYAEQGGGNISVSGSVSKYKIYLNESSLQYQAYYQ